MDTLSAVRVAAFVHTSAIEAQAVQWQAVEWLPPDAAAAGPEANQEEIAEVIVCRCGMESKHKPPSGKNGCGYWAYLRLRKGAIPDGNRAG